jgi:transposase-like protein
MYSDEERKIHVTAMKASGMTMSEYAETHGMSTRTLSTWCKHHWNQSGEETAAKRRKSQPYRESERQYHIAAYRKSGMNATAYARSVGLNKHTFHTWLSKYAGNQSKELTAVPQQAISQLKSTSAQGAKGISITTPHGLKIEIPSIDAVTIASELLKQLGVLPCG